MDLLARARSAADAAQADPQRAGDEARAVLAEPDLDPVTTATALWAEGLSARECGDLAQARARFERAVQVAESIAELRLAAQVRSSLSLVLAGLGRAEEGLAEADRAEPHLVGVEAARLRMQRALILQRLGRLDEAVDGYAHALPGLQAGGDRLAEVRLRINRSVASTYLGRLEEADDDLQQARALAQELGQHLLVAGCAHNLAFLHGRRGDVVESLRWFDRAAAEYEPLGVEAGRAAVLLSDRTEVLLAAGLAEEARACADDALRILEASGDELETAEARLLAARAALAGGDASAAASLAGRAALALNQQGRPAWAALADHLVLQAEVAGGADVATEEAASVAASLEAAGWVWEGRAARILAGRRALAAGDHERARRELAVSEVDRTQGPATQRIQAWYSEALHRMASDDPGGAKAALDEGLVVLDGARASLSTSELRAHVARLGEEVAHLRVRLALADGDAGEVLHVVEAWRAASVAPSARPPADPEVARLLALLRAAEAENRERAAAGGGADPVARKQLADLEGAVRDAARRSAGAGASPAGARAPAARDELAAALGRRVLVEWFRVDGALHAVWLVDGALSMAPLGDASAVVDEIASLRAALFRLASGAGSPASLALARTLCTGAAAELGGLLLGPVLSTVDRLGERDLVLVPTGALHHMPWGAIDVLRGRPFVVAPSATLWLDADRRRPDAPELRPLLVAGPDLESAEDEVRALAERHPGATALVGAAATVEAVCTALAGTTVAHLAAHGTFRADNPQFSAIRLHDGNLNVYDLEAAGAVPATLVVPACDVGTSTVRPGDELLGFAAALLRLGAVSLVAPVLPISDRAATRLVLDLHDHLLAGEEPSAALAAAAARAGDDDQSFAAACSFVAYGA